MKILIVIPAFPVNLQHIKGGVHSALVNLLDGFSGVDVWIRVLSFNRELATPMVVNYATNIAIHYLPEHKSFPHVFNFMWKGAAAVKTHIADFNANLVHYAMSGYILFTKLFRLPVVQLVTIHGMAFREAKQKKTIKERLVWYSNGFTESLLCPENRIHLSNYARQLFGNSSFGYSAIIPNAVSLGYFNLPIKNTTHNQLLYVGSIDANKNILLLLQSLTILAAKNILFNLSVLGDFTDEGYKAIVVDFIKKNKLDNQVIFFGWTPQPALQEKLAAADIVVVCSRQESLPMVIAEAMSAGKVVVASGVGGIPEMISDGEDGFIFNASVTNSLVDKLELLYNNNKLLVKIQNAAKAKAASVYHCTRVAQQTKAFYELLLNKKQNLPANQMAFLK